MQDTARPSVEVVAGLWKHMACAWFVHMACAHGLGTWLVQRCINLISDKTDLIG